MGHLILATTSICPKLALPYFFLTRLTYGAHSQCLVRFCANGPSEPHVESPLTEVTTTPTMKVI
jgi:hypothetical protein